MTPSKAILPFIGLRIVNKQKKEQENIQKNMQFDCEWVIFIIYQQNIINTCLQINLMDAAQSRRIDKQLTTLLNQPDDRFSFKIDPQNSRHFFFELYGPPYTCYQGGIFKIQIQLPSDYPFRPPITTFKTQIYHPNISKQGNIILQILGNNWSPALQMRSVIISTGTLLKHPNPREPFEREIGIHWLQSQKQAEEKAREYTKKYAI